MQEEKEQRAEGIVQGDRARRVWVRSKGNRQDRLVEKIEEERTQMFLQKHPVLNTAGNATFVFEAIAWVIIVTEWKSPMRILGKHVQCAM